MAFFRLFCIKKYAKNRLMKIEQFCFFPWKLRNGAFCTCYFDEDGVKTNSDVGLQSWTKKRTLKYARVLMG